VESTDDDDGPYVRRARAVGAAAGARAQQWRDTSTRLGGPAAASSKSTTRAGYEAARGLSVSPLGAREVGLAVGKENILLTLP
jgi:hypothetical protein